SDVITNEDSGPVLVNLAGITAGATNETDTLSVTATSSVPALLTVAVAYTSPSATGTLTLTPATNAFGSATITVTVNDNRASNNITTRTFTVTLNPVNDPPTLNALTNLAINADAGLQTVGLSGISAGPANENDSLTV